MKFRAQVVPSGNATAVVVPKRVVASLDAGPRPLIAVTVNGHTWRSRLALMRGQCLVGISAANRASSGIAEGDTVEVDLVVDTEPRVVDEPPDLSQALNRHPAARAAFDALPFGLKFKQVAAIEDARTVQVRQRRIDTLVAGLRPDRV